ncbi:hypothetical protein SUDANB120_04338 [Streptomyces sp. enrichment culture]|uniref:glycosyltransferase family 2 protein n=1 Tax=Streptomyces sp. enrichment culture TaxID=1795815 RepID=UPI003F54F499
MRPDDDYDYELHSRLAGPFADPDAGGGRVRYRTLLSREERGTRIRAVVLMALAPVAAAGLLLYLVWPTHRTVREGGGRWLVHLDTAMLGCIGLIMLFTLVNVVSIAHATMTARDPVPVPPEPGTRVAFLTTYVPGKEPLTMVRDTLRAAVDVRHDGHLDVWLLDEGDDPEAKALCAELGVHHFTRRGVPAWNTARGPHRARTKHGNHNAWLAAHGGAYEFLASVDTDHRPLPNYLERMLGYFRDPDTAFVVGPQVYGNYTAAVTKAAESQQYLFHALIQRAGNRYGAPMLVGTNNAVRISALRQIGGFRDSITEDMATGFELHRRRNPATGRFWRSVYTPDVLAVGEGPASWTDFFTQQLRWSRGTYETLLKQYGRGFFRMPPGRLLNYTLMLVYYPMTAVNWLLGVLSCVLFLWFGASGTQVSADVWLMLYTDAAALQVGLYLWNRRHNVSPHEPAGSGGLAGIAMSAVCAPVYLASLTSAVLRTEGRFVVTPKGAAAGTDRAASFRIHFAWAAVLAVSLAASARLGHTHAAMRTWAVLALLVCLAPPAVWAASVLRARRAATRSRTPEPGCGAGPGDEPEAAFAPTGGN